MHPLRYRILWVTIIAVALAYIESSVVVYLRALLYPEGFHFPIKPIPGFILFVEVGREIASIVLLFGLAVLAGHRRSQRFAYFFLAFGVWDIFYYLWLKVFLNWPGSWLTWDILFLIPLPWTGPVVSPVLVSLTLIAVALLSLSLEQRFGHPLRLNRWEWGGEILAGLLILLSYFWNFNRIEGVEQQLNYPYSLFIGGLLLGLMIVSVRIQKQYFHNK